MEENYDLLFKVLLVGDSSVGKTSVLLRYTDETFHAEFQSTIGVDFRIKTISMNNKVLKLQMWDTAGQDRYRNLVSSYYRGARGLIIVYDITNKASFENVPKWIEECNLRVDIAIPKVLIGNKSDLNKNRQVSFEEGKEISERLGMRFFETSAKNNENIKEVFEGLGREMLEECTRNEKVAGKTCPIIGKGAPYPHKQWCCM